MCRRASCASPPKAVTSSAFVIDLLREAAKDLSPVGAEQSQLHVCWQAWSTRSENKLSAVDVPSKSMKTLCSAALTAPSDRLGTTTPIVFLTLL